MIRVLMFYDVQGWAWWHRIHNIKEALEGRVDVQCAQLGQPFRHEDYNFILVFEARYCGHLAHVPQEKVIVGCSCPKLVEELLHILERSRPAAAVVNNEQMYSIASKYYKSYCCPNGVNEELFYPAPSALNYFTACWVGNSNALVDKGVDIINEACNQANVPLRLLDQSKEISHGKLLSQAELRDSVYHRAAVYICASEAEGTPNPALEAMACGLPVISTRVGNMTEIIEDGKNGFLVDRSVASFYRALQSMKQMNFAQMGIEARAAILRGWTWRDRAKSYEQMFYDIQLTH